MICFLSMHSKGEIKMKNIIRFFSFVTASAIITATSIQTVSQKSTEPIEQAVQKAFSGSSCITTEVNSKENPGFDIIRSDEVDLSNIGEESNCGNQDANNAPAKATNSSCGTKCSDAACGNAAGSCSPTCKEGCGNGTDNSCSKDSPVSYNIFQKLLPFLNENNKTDTGTTSSQSGTTPTKDSGTVSNTAPDNNNTAVSAYERKVVDLINDIRISNGLKPFTINEKLCNVARTKSQDMHDKGYFSHTSPTYGSPFDMMKQFGISYRTAGENIAMGYTPDNIEECISRFDELCTTLLENEAIMGFCYTQLTDVEQEQNGIYTYNREIKIDPAILKKSLSKKAAIED